MYHSYYENDFGKKSTTRKRKGLEAPQDQIHGKSFYSESREQNLYDKYILYLCHTVSLNAWDRIQELGKIVKLYPRVKQNQREPFSEVYKD